MATKLQTVEQALDALPGDTLHSAMARAFAEIEAATKGAENPAFKAGGKTSKYANLGAVIDAVKPALVNHGLWVTQHCQPSDHGVTVETILHHRSGESMGMGTLYVPANKQDPQGFGSALTYARRYAFQTAFVVPTEDDDGNAATSSVRNADARPTGPVLASGAQIAEIKALLPQTDKTVSDICDVYNVSQLDELTDEKAVRCIASLKRLVPAKEPVNA